MDTNTDLLVRVEIREEDGWLSGKEVRAALLKADPQCHLLMGLAGPFHLWATSWGHHFSVMVIGPERMCTEAELKRVLRQIERRRP